MSKDYKILFIKVSDPSAEGGVAYSAKPVANAPGESDIALALRHEDRGREGLIVTVGDVMTIKDGQRVNEIADSLPPASEAVGVHNFSL
ncbi:MAG: hypothetical protein AAF204_02065 [Pseudomonadota bacterium]